MLLTIASITCLSCTSSSDEFGGFQLAGWLADARIATLTHAVASRIRRSIRVKLPGDSERPGEIVECTAMGYALLFWRAASEENGDCAARTRGHRVSR
jgi:hypothetical protein